MTTPPTTLAPYLYSHGSLTTLLEQRAGQALHVNVVRESYQVIDFTTKKLLGLPSTALPLRGCVKWSFMAMMIKHGCVPKVYFP